MSSRRCFNVAGSLHESPFPHTRWYAANSRRRRAIRWGDEYRRRRHDTAQEPEAHGGRRRRRSRECRMNPTALQGLASRRWLRARPRLASGQLLAVLQIREAPPVEGPKGAGVARRIEYRKVNDDHTWIIQIGPDLNHSYFVAKTKGGTASLADCPRSGTKQTWRRHDATAV